MPNKHIARASALGYGLIKARCHVKAKALIINVFALTWRTACGIWNYSYKSFLLFLQFIELHPVNFHFNGQLVVVRLSNP